MRSNAEGSIICMFRDPLVLEVFVHLVVHLVCSFNTSYCSSFNSSFNCSLILLIKYKNFD